MKRIAAFVWAAVLAAPALGAQAPSTDIYLADLRISGGRVSVGAPLNVTSRTGYDNQPAFLPNGRAFLYTSVRDDAQADIYLYDLRSHSSRRVTTTTESEYSPTPMPDGARFSTVRVEADSTQRLWAFDLDGQHPRVVLEAIKPVGYHAWVNDHTLGLFVLGSPATLQLADARTGLATVEARDIGRSLQKVPGREALSFVQRDSVLGAWIKEVDVRSRQLRPIVRAVENADFFAWTPGGILLQAQGTKLYQWNPQRGGSWEEVADFAGRLDNITRLAVSRDGKRLALVAADAP